MHRALVVQPAPAGEVLAAAGLLALLTVVSARTWPVARHVVTIVHEAGHALVALCAGRRLAGIRLHSDTSGVTVSSGRPTGPGVVCTVAAGYPAPALLGLAAASLLSTGRTALLLQLFVVLLVGVLVVIRNGFGLLSVVVSIVVVLAVSMFAPAVLRGGFAAYVTWFLLIGGVRPVYEVSRFRRRGRGGGSDPDQLAHLTGLPASAWVGVFGLVSVACLAGGTALLTGVW
ncbi:M50 family metallopeptidase [Frankia nepalensis]|uniref:M50 family metallopeptidase n=1 Tax=Frankia nepalensis TaxID=1836974 RepID=UPI001EE40A5E|nr:M50 family metallopeptidase [Frankia nepalensis]